MLSESDLIKLKDAAKLSTEILWDLFEFSVIGATGQDVDSLAMELCQKNKVRPAFFNVMGKEDIYGHTVCIGINDDVVHGMPDSDRRFKNGDIITIDFGIQTRDGLYTDQCISFGLGDVSAEDKRLLETSRLAIHTAAQKAIAGEHIGTIGHTILSIAESAGFSVVEEYIGHGIGRSLHESPEIPGVGIIGQGERLAKNKPITVEAQINKGARDIIHLNDGWTVKTRDGEKSSMFEYMVIPEKKSAQILTETFKWSIIKD